MNFPVAGTMTLVTEVPTSRQVLLCKAVIRRGIRTPEKARESTGIEAEEQSKKPFLHTCDRPGSRKNNFQRRVGKPRREAIWLKETKMFA